MEKIYVKLLDEGSIAYRPVPSLKVGHDIYKLEGFDIYDMEDETWEFLPGTLVFVKSKVLSGKTILVAVQKVSDVDKI